MKYAFKGTLTALTAAAMVGVGDASATLLVSESFNYDLSLTTLNGTAATGTGLSGNWTQKHNGAGESNVVAGLVFGSLVTSGNAYQLLGDRLTGGNDRYNVANVAISAPTSASTIWHTHLIQLQVRDEELSSNSTTPNSRWQARVSVHSGQHDRTNAPAQFGFSSTRDGSTSQGTVQLAGSTNGGAALNFNQTYLVVAKLTGLHDDGVGVEKTATMWVLSLSDFNAVVADNYSETSLDDNNVYKLSRSVTNDTEVALVGQLNLHTVDWTERNFFPIYDEIRYGTTAEFVMPIPEPASLALLGLGGLMMLGGRKRSAR